MKCRKMSRFSCFFVFVCGAEEPCAFSLKNLALYPEFWGKTQTYGLSRCDRYVTWLWDTLPMKITTNEHNPMITWVSGSTGSAACGGEWAGPGGRESRNSGSTERSHQIFLNKIVNIKQFIKIYAHKFHENLCMSKSFPILSSHALLALAGVNKKPFAW